MSILQETIESLALGPATSYAGLTVFPLTAEKKGERDYLTLDAAMAQGVLKITETGPGGTVPQLLLNNEGKLPVLLLDGEELTGAKQNRVLNLTILAPAGREIIIPVSCVEAGRWAARSRAFAVADRVIFSSARRNKVESVSDACATIGRPMSNQNRVWADIDRMSCTYKVQSPTSEMGEIYRAKQRTLDSYVKAFPPLQDQVGAVFAIAGKIQGVEMFDHPRTLSDLYPKLVRSYAMDTLEFADNAHSLPEKGDVERFLADVAKADASKHDAAGLGIDLRLHGKGVTGGALLVDDRVVHLCAFRSKADSGRGGSIDHDELLSGRMMRPDWRRSRKK